MATAVIASFHLLAYHDELTLLPSRRPWNKAIQRLKPPFPVAVVDKSFSSASMTPAGTKPAMKSYERSQPILAVSPQEVRLIVVEESCARLSRTLSFACAVQEIGASCRADPIGATGRIVFPPAAPMPLDDSPKERSSRRWR